MAIGRRMKTSDRFIARATEGLRAQGDGPAAEHGDPGHGQGAEPDQDASAQVTGQPDGGADRAENNRAHGKFEAFRYAVLEFGGFLGVGTDRYPIPWTMLKYDSDKGGYLAPLDKSRLEKAPKYSDARPQTYDREFGDRINTYYDRW